MSSIDPERHFEGANLKTAAKLKILDWYLEKYVRIMENNWDEYWYVDTHAGTGRTRTDKGGLIDGSALRVINDYQGKFDRFYLYEVDHNNFETLYETLSAEFDIEFSVREAYPDDVDFEIAKCDDPEIHIFNTDSNKGVQFLANNSNPGRHWFTFIDPKGLTARKATLDTLIQRGNMDILINYQTSGIFRNAAEAATHSYEAVSQVIGDSDWPTDGSEDDYVDLYCDRLEEHDGWEVRTKNMDSAENSSYRFDLAFASSNEVGHKIMRYIMEERDDLWSEANKELGQSGLSDFYSIG